MKETGRFPAFRGKAGMRAWGKASADCRPKGLMRCGIPHLRAIQCLRFRPKALKRRQKDEVGWQSLETGGLRP